MKIKPNLFKYLEHWCQNTHRHILNLYLPATITEVNK